MYVIYLAEGGGKRDEMKPRLNPVGVEFLVNGALEDSTVTSQESHETPTVPHPVQVQQVLVTPMVTQRCSIPEAMVSPQAIGTIVVSFPIRGGDKGDIKGPCVQGGDRHLCGYCLRRRRIQKGHCPVMRRSVGSLSQESVSMVMMRVS